MSPEPETSPNKPPPAPEPAIPKANVELPWYDRPHKLPQSSREKATARKIKYTVSNLNNIGLPNRSSKDFDAGPTPKEPKPIGTYFDSLEIKRKLVTDKGTFFTIDVQPDMRFFTYYAAFTTAQNHEKIVIDNFPYVSIPSLIGYKLAILTTELLIVDLHARKTKSSFSAIFEDTTILKSTLSLLMSCKVPSDVLIPLEQLAPLKDPLRPDLEFTPSMACFDIHHDFGRTIPAYVFFMIHDIIARNTTGNSAREIINEIYSTTFLTTGQQDYTISNLFGGPYLHQQQANNHTNWFRQMLEDTLMPTIGFILQTDPTLIDNSFAPLIENDPYTENPYTYCLFGSSLNLENFLSTIESISSYYAVTEPALPTLGSVLGKISGIQILTHSIESSTLPTWHSLKTPASDVTKFKPVSDKAFASSTHFMIEPDSYKGTLPYPEEKTITPNLYQVENKPFNPATRAVKYIQFSAKDHCFPDSYWFQPYSRGTSNISHSIVLGLKIERDEFDSTIIPVPNPNSTLVNENSQYLTGCIPTSSILPHFFPRTHCPIRIRERLDHDSQYPIGIIRRDCSRNILATFSNRDINDELNGNFSYTRELDHDHLASGTTYCSWRSDEPCPYQDRTLHLWSSYRTNTGSRATMYRQIQMYYTLTGLYGTNTVLSQTRNPVKLLPH